MWRPLPSFVLAALVALAACGSGQDPVIEGAAGPTTATTVVPGTSTPADPAAVAADATVPGTAPATGDPTAPDGEAPAPEPAPVAPTSQFGPPAAGRYTFHTTGSARQGLRNEPIDTETVTVIEATGPDTIRQASSSDQGSQTTELRYESGRVALTLLELTFGPEVVRFTSAEGVQFSPVPPDPGLTWSWQLTDETGQLVADFAGTTQPREAITVLGASVDSYVLDATIHVTGTFSGLTVDATVQLRTWIDPGRRTPVRLHQVTTIAQPALLASTADTTSELTGFEPA